MGVRSGSVRMTAQAAAGHNSLTILGSRAASLTSVIIAQLFSSTFNEDKKLLAFSDSVQDASHRSGFFAARTYTFNLRSAIQKTVRVSRRAGSLRDTYCPFPGGLAETAKAGEFLATFLPPDMDWLDDYEALRTAGKLPEGSDLMGLLDRRLAWEIWSEYTFRLPHRPHAGKDGKFHARSKAGHVAASC